MHVLSHPLCSTLGFLTFLPALIHPIDSGPNSNRCATFPRRWWYRQCISFSRHFLTMVIHNLLHHCLHLLDSLALNMVKKVMMEYSCIFRRYVRAWRRWNGHERSGGLVKGRSEYLFELSSALSRSTLAFCKLKFILLESVLTMFSLLVWWCRRNLKKLLSFSLS